MAPLYLLHLLVGEGSFRGEGRSGWVPKLRVLWDRTRSLSEAEPESETERPSERGWGGESQRGRASEREAERARESARKSEASAKGGRFAVAPRSKGDGTFASRRASINFPILVALLGGRPPDLRGVAPSPAAAPTRVQCPYAAATL